MDRNEVPCSAEATPKAAAPRVLEWIWHPWYAKLWWAAIATYWGSALLVSWLGIRRLPVDRDVLMYAGMILHPQVALPVLGFGYVRALLKYHRDHGDSAADDVEGADWRDDVAHGLFGRDRFMAYLSDPADPRSPLSRYNPANSHYIHRPDD